MASFENQDAQERPEKDSDWSSKEKGRDCSDNERDQESKRVNVITKRHNVIHVIMSLVLHIISIKFLPKFLLIRVELQRSFNKIDCDH